MRVTSLVMCGVLIGQLAGGTKALPAFRAAAQARAAQLAAAPKVSAGLGAKLDELISRYQPHGFSGTVLIAQNGKVLLQKGYGLANRATNTPVTTDTLYDAGSLAKTFTAAAILRLEMEGKLSVSDPMGKHLPGVPADKAGVTLAHLLAHTSGIARDTPDLSLSGNFTRDELVDRALSAPLRFVPGQRYAYSNVGFNLLAAIIERASGTTWQAYLSEKLIRPARLSRTTFWEPAMAQDPRVAVGYRGLVDDMLSPGAAEAISWSRGLGATGVWTTVGDLYQWWLALQKEGVLSESARKRIFTAPAVGDEPYGWHIQKTASGLARIHKGGVVSNFEMQFCAYPESGVVMIFAMNKNIGMRAPMWDAIERVILAKDYVLPPVIPNVTVALDKYAGEYALPSGGKFITSVERTRLVVGATGQDAINPLGFPSDTDPQLHRDTNALTARIVEMLRKGEAITLPEVPEPANLARFWQRGAERFGALKSYQVLGTGPRGEGLVQTYMRMEFEQGTEVLRFSWADGRLGPIGTGIPIPALTRFFPESETRFASFDFRTAEVTRVEFERDASGAATALRILGRDGKPGAAARKLP